MEVVTAGLNGQIAPSGTPAIYTRNPLTMPSFDQLIVTGTVFIAKVLGEGQLPAVITDLYTVVTPTVTSYVKRFTVFNTNAATQTIVWYIFTNSGYRKINQISLAQNESADLILEGEAAILNAGDKIAASTTNASAVDYYLAGVEEIVA
jgi:hypothetical protein